MRFDLGTLDSGERSLPFGLLVLLQSSQWCGTFQGPVFFCCSLVSDAAHFKDQYLSWKSWHKWCVQIINKISPSSATPYFEGQDDPNGQSPAIEVLNYKDPAGYFAGKSVSPIQNFIFTLTCVAALKSLSCFVIVQIIFSGPLGSVP